MLSFVLAVQKTQLWETVIIIIIIMIIIIIIIINDEDYARCSLYNFWCNSDLCFLSDCVKMWTTCASFICSTRLRSALADF